MKVLITGITGQDGSYLSQSLLADGAEIHGIVRQSSLEQRTRLDKLPDLKQAHSEGRLRLHYADLTDSSSIYAVVRLVKPDYLYHLAGHTHVQISYDLPEYTAQTTALGTLRILEALRQEVPKCRFFLAATSEIFGDPQESPQKETTPWDPRNPYAAAKVYALNLVRIYRSVYGLFACSGILFNHESPRRGEIYVTRKISRAAARIFRGRERELVLGSLAPRRDWSFAPDIVRGMRLIAEAPSPSDYVLASGESHSVEEFCRLAFAILGLDYRDYVRGDNPAYKRPNEIRETRGDSSMARTELGWRPEVGFEELVRILVESEVAMLDSDDE
jgi:GDPmannose 4,6-dehydratase